MMRIMVVDDDFSVRFNVKRLLEMPIPGKAENPYVLVAEAADGQEAVELLEHTQPDIIISDIRMPHMDGLELQNYLLQKNIRIKMIMLSGYDDYEYVREALKNGAVDYILKHKLEQELLLEALLAAGKQLSGTYESTEQRYADSLLALKRDFTKKVILGCYQSVEEISRRAQTLDIKMGLRSNMVVLMQVFSENPVMNTDYLMEFSVLNIVDEVLQDAGFGVCCRVSDEKYAFLMNFEHVYSEKLQQEQYSALCGRISMCLKTYLNMNVFFYAGRVVPNILDAKLSEQTARVQYENRYYKEIRHMDFHPFDLLAVFDAEREKALIAAIRGDSVESALEVIRSIFIQLKQYKATAIELQNLFTDILSAMNRGWKERGVDLSQLYQHRNIRERFHDFNSLQNAEDWFLHLTEQVFGENRMPGAEPSSPYVSQAVSYIHSHYLEDISLGMAAEAIGISPAYLSKLMKEDLKMGFSIFLCSYRISRAKNLLLKKNLSNKEVARMSGFGDDAYFARAFKKSTGMTPSEYRKAVEKSNES